MQSVTYRVAISTARRLASSPRKPPPTPSATMARNATRSVPVGTGEKSGRLLPWIAIDLCSEQMRK
jgi:hypothetical protein